MKFVVLAICFTLLALTAHPAELSYQTGQSRYWKSNTIDTVRLLKLRFLDDDLSPIVTRIDFLSDGGPNKGQVEVGYTGIGLSWRPLRLLDFSVFAGKLDEKYHRLEFPYQFFLNVSVTLIEFGDVGVICGASHMSNGRGAHGLGGRNLGEDFALCGIGFQF